MKHKTRIGILGGLLAALLLIFTPIPASAAADTARDTAEGILAAAQNGASLQAWVDGDLADAAGISAEWYIFALVRAGESCDFSAYRAALTEYLADHTVPAAATRQKFALAYLATGQSHAYVTKTLADSIGEMGIMSWVFGLHLLQNGCVSDTHTAESVTDTLLRMQCADGGWALTGDTGTVDVTAMTLQALAPAAAENKAVADAAEKALAFLSARQTESGGYIAYGQENAESAAQVLLALCALGIDAAEDPRFIKSGCTVIDALAGFRTESGAIAHERGGTPSESATGQTLSALTAYLALTETGEGTLFDFHLTKEQLTAPEEPAEEPAAVEDAPAGYKTWAILAAVVAGAVACAVLILCKKRHPKNFLLIGAVLAAGILFILLTDFQSPEQYYGTAAPKENVIGTVTVTIRCDTVAGQAEHIPADGVILPETVWEIAAGDTVCGVLFEIARQHRIQIENDGTEKLAYITGIAHLYAQDFGDLSGWVYHVNGESPAVGCGEYVLADGDRVEWLYTRDLGEDVQKQP